LKEYLALKNISTPKQLPGHPSPTAKGGRTLDKAKNSTSNDNSEMPEANVDICRRSSRHKQPKGYLTSS
jgi:hypothetical protein